LCHRSEWNELPLSILPIVARRLSAAWLAAAQQENAMHALTPRWPMLAATCGIFLAASGCHGSPPAATKRVQFGAHIGSGCNGRDAIPAFEGFVGRKLERSVDFFDQSDWTAYRNSIPWISGCWKNVPIALTLSVPMLVSGDRSTLHDGAAGAHDDMALLVARTLVRDGLGGTTIRIGWEFNGDWMPWAAANDPQDFIAYYRRMVGLMRSVPGQHFKFEWTTSAGRNAMAPDQTYPGDDVVDIIGMDVYNETWNPIVLHASPELRFAWLRDQPYGMRWLRDFAAQHAKPAAYSEWGSGTREDGHGGGDDPYFITRMAEWFRESGASYQSYWETAGKDYDDRLTTGSHHLAAAAFRKAFADTSAPVRDAGTERP
jgi:hypothetical protein